ncbi:MAG: cytochrome b/b6 domain-containing protein [Gammaproteobacteria bacterium]
MKTRILVWDLPVRLFHWLLVACFAGAWLTSESERWRDVHAMLGYTLLGLIAFRVAWGFAGTRYARFSQFLAGPAAVRDYLFGLVRGSGAHHIGHNPAGAVAIVLLLGLGVLVGLSGWATFNDLGGDFVEEVHEVLASGMLAVVVVHVAGVAASSLLHRENLVRAMVDGHKQGEAAEGIRGARPLIAAAMVAAVVAFWTGADWSGGGTGPAAAAIESLPHPTPHGRPHREDDD